MTSFVALVGQQTSSKVEQGTEIAWKEFTHGSPSSAAWNTTLLTLFSQRVAILPSAYSGPASLAEGDGQDRWEAFRVGTCVCRDKMIAYFGRFTFAQFSKNSRGRTPFGLAYGVVLDEDGTAFNPNITDSVSRLFEEYRRDAVEAGMIVKPVRAYNDENIAKKWGFSAKDFVLDDTSRTLPLLIDRYADNVATFIAREDHLTLADIVSRLKPLMNGSVMFDAFIAIDPQLDRNMKAQASSGIIKYLSIDDFVEAVVPRDMEPSAPPRLSSPETSSAAPAPAGPVSPPASKIESQTVALQPAGGAQIPQNEKPGASPLVVPLQQIADGLSELKHRFPETNIEGPPKIFESPVAKVALAVLLACGPLALAAVGYDRYSAPDRNDERPGAQSEVTTAVDRCLAQEVQIVALSNTNPVWQIVLQKAMETPGDAAEINGLTIAEPKQFVQAGHAMFLEQMRQCLERH